MKKLSRNKIRKLINEIVADTPEWGSEYGSVIHQTPHQGRGTGFPGGSMHMGSGYLWPDYGVNVDRTGRITLTITVQDGSGDSYDLQGQLDEDSIQDLMELGIIK